MGTLDPAFVLAPQLLITAKPLITDLTQINCSSQSVVPTTQFLENAVVISRVLNAADKSEFVLLKLIQA